MDSSGDTGTRARRYRAASPAPSTAPSLAPLGPVSAVSSMPELVNKNSTNTYDSMPFFGNQLRVGPRFEVLGGQSNAHGAARHNNSMMREESSSSSSFPSSSSSSTSGGSSHQLHHHQRHRANSWSEGQSNHLPRSTSSSQSHSNKDHTGSSQTPTTTTTTASGSGSISTAAGFAWPSSPRTPRQCGSGINDSGGSGTSGGGVGGGIGGWSPRARQTGAGDRGNGGGGGGGGSGSLHVPSSPATREAARLAEGGLLLGFFQSVQKSASTGDLEGLLQHASQQEAASNPGASGAPSLSSSSGDRSGFPRFAPTSPQRSPPPMHVLELPPANLAYGPITSSFYAHDHSDPLLRAHPTGALHLFPGSPNSAAAAAATATTASAFAHTAAGDALAVQPPLLAVDEGSRLDSFFGASSSSSSSLPAVTPEEGHPPRAASPLPASLHFSALRRSASREVTPESSGHGDDDSNLSNATASPHISPALSAQSAHSNEGISSAATTGAVASTTTSTMNAQHRKESTPGSAAKRKAPPYENEEVEVQTSPLLLDTSSAGGEDGRASEAKSSSSRRGALSAALEHNSNLEGDSNSGSGSKDNNQTSTGVSPVKTRRVEGGK